MENRFLPYQASPVPPAQCVLVLAPHPDDEVFGCGGCLALYQAQGVPVHVLLLTDGGAGVDPNVRAQYVAQRRQESEAAGRVLGYVVEQLPYQDRMLGQATALVTDIVSVVQRLGADLVYAPSPWEIHPDHYHAAWAAQAALRLLPESVRLATYEVGMPQRPNRLVDITAVAARKRVAMDCFTSQLALQRYAEQVTGLNVFRSYTLGPDVAMAEALTVFGRDDLEKDPCDLQVARRQREWMQSPWTPPSGTGQDAPQGVWNGIARWWRCRS